MNHRAPLIHTHMVIHTFSEENVVVLLEWSIVAGFCVGMLALFGDSYSIAST